MAPRRPRHITVAGRRWPQRYFSGVPKLLRQRNLVRRQTTGQFRLGRSDAMAKPRKSQWTLLFHKVYPDLPFKKDLIARRTGIPRKVLNTVYDRGRRAWQTGGSRPGMTANQWGVARVYKFVLLTKKKAPVPNRYDPNQNLRAQLSSFRPTK